MERIEACILTLEDDAITAECDDGERLAGRLHPAAGLVPHHLEGIVGAPVRVIIVYSGERSDAVVHAIEPADQHRPLPRP